MLNKIISKYCILFYQKCWKDRNEHYHNEEEQKQRVIAKKREKEKHAETNKKINIQNFIRWIYINE